MSNNTGSYVLSSQDTTLPTYTDPQPSYLQQPERTHAQSTQPVSYNYNQPTGPPMSQFSPSAQQQQNDCPPSYPPSHSQYPNMHSGGGSGEPAVYQQPMSEPEPVAQEAKKPLFSPETKQRTKYFCAECGSGARWACGAVLLACGCMFSFIGYVLS